MTIGELTRSDLRHTLAGPGCLIRTGPFLTRLRTPLPEIASALQQLYSDFPVESSDRLVDFRVVLASPSRLRRWWRSQVVFYHDGEPVFRPFPRRFAFPLLEWGLNWCASTHAHQYLIVHAAVVARDRRALMLPGPPGSGKSTLCAGLVCRGWRLLSDELALIRPGTGELLPLCRPVSLKGPAIDLIEVAAPHAILGPRFFDTHKGTVAHLRPPLASVTRAHEPARLGWLVFPRYDGTVSAECHSMRRAPALLELVANAFNYGVHGPVGFSTLADLVERSACFEFRYGRLEDATECLDRMTTA